MEFQEAGANRYSQTWFKVFLETHPFTDGEVAFLRRQLPLPEYGKVLDVACGRGRHAIPLATSGYRIVGIDRDRPAIEHAQAAARELDVRFEVLDMLELSTLEEGFDAVLLLWQSFGFFSRERNRRVLADMASLIRPGGRIILDLYNREFWESNQGGSVVRRGGSEARIENHFESGRLRTRITYGATRDVDVFDWQLFTPDELNTLGEQNDLTCVLLCTEYDEGKRPTRQSKAFQIVFEL